MTTSTPPTAALAELGNAEVLRVLRSTGGNVAGLAQDYDQLSEEIFRVINEREADQVPTTATSLRVEVS